MSVNLERKLQAQIATGTIKGKQADKARSLIAESKDYREAYGEVLVAETPISSAEAGIPEMPPELAAVQEILTDKGFSIAHIAYVNREKGEVTHALIETIVRPDYTDGTQMYYSSPDEDPLAKILEKGRQEKKIAVPSWVKHVPTKSRFAVSWDEAHNFVFPEVVETIPGLKKQVAKNGIVFRVPTKAEFRFAGKSHPHFGTTNSWEWLYDKAIGGSRLVGGHRAHGGTEAVYDWQSDFHYVPIGFRLQAVSPPQKLTR